MSLIATVIVGSTLHGLNDEQSDIDSVNIVMSHPHKLFSPYYVQRGTKDHSQENEDNSSFELRHLLYLCTKGNPTALEIVRSNLLEHTTPVWDYVKSSVVFPHLLGAKAVYEAHLGYSKSQRHLKEGQNERRQIKARIAELRILQQGMELLQYGAFDPYIGAESFVGKTIMAYKRGDRSAEPLMDAWIETALKMLEIKYQHTTLPDKFNVTEFEKVLFDLYTEWE